MCSRSGITVQWILQTAQCVGVVRQKDAAAAAGQPPQPAAAAAAAVGQPPLPAAAVGQPPLPAAPPTKAAAAAVGLDV